jgi:TPR repeat protein
MVSMATTCKKVSLISYTNALYVGVKNAPRVAARLYIVASEQGDGDAQYTLAQLLRIGGAGLAKDPEWAAALLKEAACDARPVAQLALGMMLMNGEAGPTDHTQAYAHILAAAANGFVAAHNVLGMQS